MANSSAKAFLKGLLFPSGPAPRVIRGGLVRDLRMQLDFASHTQLWLGLQEREINGWLQDLSEGIQTAFDVGANEGIYTLYFLARTSARKVIAFEPLSENLRCLERNLELNRLRLDSRLDIVPKWVGAAENNEWTTLDSFLQSIISPCLVKVDIEGGEVKLLLGAQRLLHFPDVRWIIEVHSEKLEQECAQVLKASEYHTLVVPNAWWRLFLPEQRPAGFNRWLVAIPK